MQQEKDQKNKMKEHRKQSKLNLRILVIALVTYVVSAFASFLLFNSIGAGSIIPVDAPKKTADGKLLFDPNLPKTEPCPLNGAKWSVQQRDWWEEHSPLGVMIENHLEARPQSGLTSADIVYEAVAEGGITRFLAIFYCQNADVVGPIRSARTYFLDFLSEYGSFPLYAHVGGANTPGPANALGQIVDYGWSEYNDLNQFSIGFPVFIRDYDRLGRTVATEHTVYSSTLKLWDYARDDRGITDVNEDGDKWNEDFTAYSVKEDAQAGARPTSQSITYNFWDGYGDFLVEWTYDPTSNTYKRSNGGEAHTDLNNKQQIAAKNVVLLFMRESRANDGYEGNLHLLYGTKGTGSAIVFQDGKEIDANWTKKARTSHLELTDNRGNEIELNPGLIWFSIVSPGTDVEVE